VVVLGGLCIDFLYFKDHFVWHTSNPASSNSRVGGVGFNLFQALPFDEKRFVSLVGDDGLAHLVHAELENTLGQKDLHSLPGATPSTIRFMEKGEFLVGAADFNLWDRVDANVQQAFLKSLQDATHVLLEANLPPKLLGTLASFCVAQKLPFAFDCVSVEKTQRSMPHLKGAHVIKADALEAGKFGQNAEEIQQGISTHHVSHFLWTQGSQGLTWITPSHIRSFQVPEVVHGVDTTGAGDHFLAQVLFFFWREGLSMEQAIGNAMESVADMLKGRLS